MKLSHILILSLLVIVAAAGVAEYTFMPYGGDDFAYMTTLRTSTGFDGRFPLWLYPKSVALHWLLSNGRMANFLAPLFLALFPKWLNSLILGCCMALLPLLILKLGRVNDRPLLGVAVIAVVMWAFPWWDFMMTVDFALNYSVSTVSVLAVGLLFRRRPDCRSVAARVALFVLGGVAGCMHEALTLPLLAGAGLYIWKNRLWSSLPAATRMLALGFAAGVAVVFLSPGIWSRFGQDFTPDDPLPILLLKSVPVTLSGLLLLIAVSLIPSSRPRLVRFLSSDASVWIIASLLSTGFCAVGGIVGRSGWFSQTFALVAICRWFSMSPVGRVKRPYLVAASLLAILVSVQSVASAVVLCREGSRMIKAETLYGDSADGVVFFDIPRENELPLWTLGRARFIDDDDRYQAHLLMLYYPLPRPVFLPSAARRLNFATLHFARFSNGDIITDSCPPDAVLDDSYDYPSVMRVTDPDGAVRIAVPFTRADRTFYYVTPRILDLGDREH